MTSVGKRQIALHRIRLSPGNGEARIAAAILASARAFPGEMRAICTGNSERLRERAVSFLTVTVSPHCYCLSSPSPKRAGAHRPFALSEELWRERRESRRRECLHNPAMPRCLGRSFPGNSSSGRSDARARSRENCRAILSFCLHYRAHISPE